ncbi:hypothetical protein, conserved [Eimeria acervulina]|uniref:Uncharacterized protein n=1 Tax=Eimeria acervulina TaxID=5801 RepID=U6GMT8_EIMAC|nr:hypothetical protein, conserved [Eimeria acervulina]CDI80578.1 hypothetical protein, conserved [Eimeria acervulina]
MEPVLSVGRGPSRVTRLRTRLFPGLAHPENAETVITSEPPIAFAGPKVLICRRRTGSSTQTTGPLKAIQTAFRKITSKRRQVNQVQQHQLAISVDPTLQTESLSNASDPPCERFAQEQDLETVPCDDCNQSSAERKTGAVAEPQNNSPAATPTPATTQGMKKGFALPHDCPTIIEGEEWGSGECSEPEEVLARPNSYTPTSAVHTSVAEAAAALATLETTEIHMHTPTLDAAFLQSGALLEKGYHSCSAQRAHKNWHATLIAPWKASKTNLSQLSASHSDRTPEVIHENPKCSYSQDVQLASGQPNRAFPAPAQGSCLPGHWTDATGRAEKTTAAAAVPRNSSTTHAQGQGPRQRDGERNGVGCSSVIASFMERVVSMIEGSAAVLSSCGTADIIDESQLVVSSGRIARARQALQSAPRNNAAAIHSRGAPSLQMHQQSCGGCEDTNVPNGHSVPAQVKPNSAREPDHQSCSSGGEKKWEGKSCDGNQEEKLQEDSVKRLEEKFPGVPEEFSCADKQEKEESGLSSVYPGVSHKDSTSAKVNLPDVSLEEIKKLDTLPEAAMMRLRGTYIMACTAECARLHIQHFESNKAEVVNIARCTTTFAGLDQIKHSKYHNTWDQRPSAARKAVSNEYLDAATKTGRCNARACSSNQKLLVETAANASLWGLSFIPAEDETEAVSPLPPPPSPRAEKRTTNGNLSLGSLAWFSNGTYFS